MKNLKTNFSDYSATSIEDVISSIQSELNGYNFVSSVEDAEKFLENVKNEGEFLQSDIEHSSIIIDDTDKDASWQPSFRITITSFFYDGGSEDYVYTITFVEL